MSEILSTHSYKVEEKAEKVSRLFLILLKERRKYEEIVIDQIMKEVFPCSSDVRKIIS